MPFIAWKHTESNRKKYLFTMISWGLERIFDVTFFCSIVWSIKIRAIHNLSLWLCEYFWIILLYGHLVCFILKVLAWEISNMKWGFAKKVLIKSQRQFMYGSNFYETDVSKITVWKDICKPCQHKIWQKDISLSWVSQCW